MVIDLSWNIKHDLTAKLMPVRTYTGSRLNLSVSGVAFLDKTPVKAVKVELTNADGIVVNGDAIHYDVGIWRISFNGTVFAAFGTVINGIRVIAVTDDGETIVGCADLVIEASSSYSRPGTPNNNYQMRGEELYIRSNVVSCVQHYKRVTIGYNDRLNSWGFNDPEGDYILDASGRYVDASAN